MLERVVGRRAAPWSPLFSRWPKEVEALLEVGAVVAGVTSIAEKVEAVLLPGGLILFHLLPSSIHSSLPSKATFR